MMTAIVLLLALIGAELGFLSGLAVVAVRRMTAGERPSEGTAPPSVPPTSDSEEKKAEDFEKRWQETMDRLMSYDMEVARKAVRRDADESDG